MSRFVETGEGMTLEDGALLLADYDPDEERDDHGRWSGGGGTSASSASSAASPAQKPSQKEIDALFDYVDMSQGLNARLRTDQKLTETQQRMTDDLDAFLGRQSYPNDETLYRGVSGTFADKLDSLKAGDEIVDKAYVSTSKDLAVTEEFGPKVMVIKINKGARARYVSNMMGDEAMTAEKEVLISRNSKLRFESRSGNQYKFSLAST